jgi:hypothetical protein
MDKHEKTIKLLESFLSDKEVDGVCSYMVIPDDSNDSIQVIVILDIDYIKQANTKPGFVAKMIREGVRQEIKKWLGLDVYVGSTSKKCDEIKSLSESMSPHVKRRLSNIKLLDELTNMLDYEINLSYYDTSSDAVEDICSMLNDRILDEIWEETNLKVSLKEKDELYWYLHKKFEKYIANRFKENEGINESIVYDYKEGRNESPKRLPFDVNKLINAGAVFITPAIEGDSSSKNYKKFLKKPYTHLITLHNLRHSSPDSWIHTAVTRSASPKHWEGKEFTNNLYDGKYNQILWSLDELGIPYESMLIDDIKESQKKYIVTESQLKRIKEYFDPIHYLKKIMNDDPKYIKDPSNLKYEEAFQKVVDVIFKYTMKHSPVDNLKGLEISKVTPQGFGDSSDSKNSHTEWTVVAHSILPKWFNPNDDNYKSQMEKFKTEFKSIAEMMGLSSSSPLSKEGFPFDKVRFQIYND